jgi:hypothetical protein
MRHVDFDGWEFREIVHEFELIRRSHLSFFRHLDSEAWLRKGTANNAPVSVRALAYMVAGHTRHHVGILRKRLGQA